MQKSGTADPDPPEKLGLWIAEMSFWRWHSGWSIPEEIHFSFNFSEDIAWIWEPSIFFQLFWSCRLAFESEILSDTLTFTWRDGAVKFLADVSYQDYGGNDRRLNTSGVDVFLDIRCSLFRPAPIFRTGNQTRSTKIVENSEDSVQPKMESP
jgi:hypothetical protein